MSLLNQARFLLRLIPPHEIALLIMLPLLWLAQAGVPLPVSPLYAAILVALVLVFWLGVFLGRIAAISWLRGGIQTLLVALFTTVLIYLFTGH